MSSDETLTAEEEKIQEISMKMRIIADKYVIEGHIVEALLATLSMIGVYISVMKDREAWRIYTHEMIDVLVKEFSDRIVFMKNANRTTEGSEDDVR
jgi:hypothetical protein